MFISEVMEYLWERSNLVRSMYEQSAKTVTVALALSASDVFSGLSRVGRSDGLRTSWDSGGKVLFRMSSVLVLFTGLRSSCRCRTTARLKE